MSEAPSSPAYSSSDSSANAEPDDVPEQNTEQPINFNDDSVGSADVPLSIAQNVDAQSSNTGSERATTPHYEDSMESVGEAQPDEVQPGEADSHDIADNTKSSRGETPPDTTAEEAQSPTTPVVAEEPGAASDDAEEQEPDADAEEQEPVADAEHQEPDVAAADAAEDSHSPKSGSKEPGAATSDVEENADADEDAPADGDEDARSSKSGSGAAADPAEAAADDDMDDRIETSSLFDAAGSDSDVEMRNKTVEEEDKPARVQQNDSMESISKVDLFGADSSSSSDEEKDEERVDTEPNRAQVQEDESQQYKTNEQGELVGRFSGEEEEPTEEQEPQETVIEVDIPKCSFSLGEQIHFVKFPNFLSVEPRAFDAETYDEDDEDEVLDEEGRSRLKLRVENTVRWRKTFNEDGEEGPPESNTKVVRWSDGTMSLHLGTEVFDIHQHPLHGDHNHLFIRLGTGLQAQSVFRTKLTFRPHSTESSTHRKMTMQMADRTRSQKVKILSVVGADPEAQRQDMVKKEEDRMRATARRESQQRRLKERQASRGLTSSYLEGDDDGQGDSISALKRKYKSRKMVGGGSDLSSAEESEESDIETGRRSRNVESDDDGQAKQKKRRIIDDSDEEAAEGSGTEQSEGSEEGSESEAKSTEDEEEEGPTTSKAKKKKVADDSEDEEDEDVQQKAKKKKVVDDDSDEEDAEVAEAQQKSAGEEEEEESEKSKKRQEAATSGEEDEGGGSGEEGGGSGEEAGGSGESSVAESDKNEEED